MTVLNFSLIIGRTGFQFFAIVNKVIKIFMCSSLCSLLELLERGLQIAYFYLWDIADYDVDKAFLSSFERGDSLEPVVGTVSTLARL